MKHGAYAKSQLLLQLQEVLGRQFEPVLEMSRNSIILQHEMTLAVERHRWLYTASLEDLVMHGVDVEASALEDARSRARAYVVSLAKECNTEWDRVAKYVTPTLKSTELNVNDMRPGSRPLAPEEIKALNNELEHEFRSPALH